MEPSSGEEVTLPSFPSDVKPSNVLINTLGQVKMCDFGISGYLVDSVAKTIDAGCKPYMAVSTSMQHAFVHACVHMSEKCTCLQNQARK